MCVSCNEPKTPEPYDTDKAKPPERRKRTIWDMPISEVLELFRRRR